MWSPTAHPERQPVRLAATRTGPEVAAILGGCRHGQVLAVLPAVAYLALDRGLLCLARRGVETGPFSIELPIPPGVDLHRLGIDRGDPVQADAGRLEIPGRLQVQLAAARPWRPAPWPERPDRDRIARGLGSLRRLRPPEPDGRPGCDAEGRVPGCDPAAGIALTLTAALAAAGPFAAAAAAGRFEDTSWARPLLGLGPGLTPSGDDILVGFLLGLHAAGAGWAAELLWREIRHEAASATHPISLTFLASAARGQGVACLHDAIGGILAGGLPGAVLDRLSALGRTTGRDAMRGATTALAAWTGMAEAASLSPRAACRPDDGATESRPRTRPGNRGRPAARTRRPGAGCSSAEIRVGTPGRGRNPTGTGRGDR